MREKRRDTAFRVLSSPPVPATVPLPSSPLFPPFGFLSPHRANSGTLLGQQGNPHTLLSSDLLRLRVWRTKQENSVSLAALTSDASMGPTLREEGRYRRSFSSWHCSPTRAPHGATRSVLGGLIRWQAKPCYDKLLSQPVRAGSATNPWRARGPASRDLVC